MDVSVPVWMRAARCSALTTSLIVLASLFGCKRVSVPTSGASNVRAPLSLSFAAFYVPCSPSLSLPSTCRVPPPFRCLLRDLLFSLPLM